MHEERLLSPELTVNHIEANIGSAYVYQTHSTTTSPHTDAEQGTPNIGVSHFVATDST